MKKFIKEQWLYILLIACTVTYCLFKLDAGQYADALFALGFVLVAVKASLLNADLIELREDYEQLIVDYVNELRDNIEFIGKTKARVELMADQITTEVKPKRGRPKKVAQPAKPKRGRPKKNA